MNTDTMQTDSKVTTQEQRNPIVEFLRTRATITTDPLEEDDGPEGHFSSGDDKEDARTCAKIRADHESGNVWAWTCVRVRAEYLGHTGEDYLGGCSYASREEFERPGDYHSDMVDTALNEVAHSLILDTDALAEVVAELQATADSDAGRDDSDLPELAPGYVAQGREQVLGKILMDTAAEYHLLKSWTRDADAADVDRSPLFDALHRDAMRSIMRQLAKDGFLS